MTRAIIGLFVMFLVLSFDSIQSFAAAPAAPKSAPVHKVIKPSADVAGPTAVLTWTAPTTNTDGTPIVDPITYNVYQGTSATALTEVQTGVTALTVTMTSGLTDNSTVYFAVTAVVDGNESAQSAPGSKTFPAGVPSAPVLTVQ